MNKKEYLNKMRNVEEKLLNFIDQESNEEENFENFINIVNDSNIQTDQHDLRIILYLISKISSNHHRLPNFYDKIDKILKTMKEEIKHFFSNEEIFKIFKTNKRILLFLIEEEIFTIDNSFFMEIMTIKYKEMQYPEYFSFEIKSFIDEENQSEKFRAILKEDLEKFNKKRKKGENDGYLYQIIQNDLIDEFITYVNLNFYPLNSYVEESIYETNEFLLKQEKTKLIEYAAFYGSTQIFKYLYKNKAEMTPSLWLYAIHGCDEEIIHILEEKNIKIENEIKPMTINKIITCKQCIEESIKCHHDYITNYILDNFLGNEKISNNDIFIYCLKYYNLIYFDVEKIENDSLFIYASKYDYYKIVENLLNTKEIDLNNLIICILFFF